MKLPKIFGIFKTLLLCAFCKFPSKNAASLESELEMASRWWLWSCLLWCIPNHFRLLSAASRNLHEFPCDRRKKRRRTRLSASASKVIGLWPIWPRGPSSPTQPIRAQTSCSAAGRRGGMTADYNQRQSDFIRHKTSLHVFGEQDNLIKSLTKHLRKTTEFHQIQS